MAIDHVDLVVRSLEESLAFYRGLLGPLGYVRVGEIVGERGERVIYLDRVEGGGTVGLRESQSGEETGPDRYRVGLHHLAFVAPSRAAVEESARWLRERGACIESGPADYDYAPRYFAVFFRDPDGLKLEIVHRPRERDLAATVRELSDRIAQLERRT